ncbi:MAG TPA: hypothetical protein VG733_10620, partial [Chthoniobacteraceae bacterium]|nr:hypothetical protein [Chthoniobacteraceae bacterium]
DIYEAPLNPLVNSFFLLLDKGSWAMTIKDYVYRPDQIISIVAILFFALGVGVNYLTACRVFDPRIAGLSAGLVIFCNQFWVFATTGLPQLLMFFIFSCCLHCMYRAIEARRKDKPVLIWLGAAAFLFGLLALAHAISIWIFAGALVFSLIYFVPRGQAFAIMLVIFCMVYTPWLARNYKVCGNAFGLGPLSLIGTMDGSESDRMRSEDTSFTGLGLGALRSQVRAEFLDQTGSIYKLLGQIPVAPVFFLTLLYVFKRKEASDLLWCVFLMFAFAFTGMCVSGHDNANNLYLLFIPIMTLYGFAYVMMLWSRLEFNITLLRYIFIVCIYIVSMVPLISDMWNAPPPWSSQWPPYAPLGIAYIRSWTKPNEVVASDMPWAVAWYGDRKSLLIPGTMDDFMNFCDWTEFSDDLSGLYLTPITGDQPFISGIIKGEGKDWAPFLLRSFRPNQDFPFRYVIQLPRDGDCVFYCKSDRWSPKAD